MIHDTKTDELKKHPPNIFRMSPPILHFRTIFLPAIITKQKNNVNGTTLASAKIKNIKVIKLLIKQMLTNNKLIFKLLFNKSKLFSKFIFLSLKHDNDSKKSTQK